MIGKEDYNEARKWLKKGERLAGADEKLAAGIRRQLQAASAGTRGG